MVLIPNSANSANSGAFNNADFNIPAGPIDNIRHFQNLNAQHNVQRSVQHNIQHNLQAPEVQHGKVRFQKMKELKQKFKEHNHKFKEHSRGIGRNFKAHSRERFFSFADALEAYVDKKLGRFYITRKEHDEARRLYEYQLELARQRAIMAEMEKEAIRGSALESRRVVEELSDDAKKLLELNSQLKELLKQSIGKKVLSDSAPGSEVVIKTMKQIRKDFDRKPKKKVSRKNKRKKQRKSLA